MMIKLIILLQILILIFSLTFSGWYGPHPISYSTSPSIKNCDDDPDGISDPVCVQIGSQGPTLGGTTCPSGPVSVPTNGTMTCRYWDGQTPTVSINYTSHSWINNLTLNISLSDAGGSKLQLVRYRWRIDGSRGSWITQNSNINSNYYSFSLNVPEGVVYLQLYVKDGAQNITYVTYGPYYIDKTSPSISYLYNYLDGKPVGDNVLANDSANLRFVYSQPCYHNACAPVKVYYKYEIVNNNLYSSQTYIYGGNNGTYSNADDDGKFDKIVNWNVSKVLPSIDFSTTTGGRLYSIKIDKICDDAGNCVYPNQVRSWWVYANTPVGYEVVASSDLNNVKIGNNNDVFNLYLILKDQYGNPVVPAPGINRKINININYDNDVYLNQYKLQGAGIVYQYKLGSWQSSNIGNNKYFGYIYTNYDSNLYNGQYYFRFKSYVPTYDGYDKAYGRFKVGNISYNITQNEFGIWNNSFTINKYLKFKPQVYTKIVGIPPLAAEGTYKDFKIQFFTNGSQNYTASTFMVQFDPKGEPIDTYLSYNTTGDWGKFAIYGYNNSNLISNLNSVASNKIGNYSSWSDISPADFYEKFILKPGGTLNSSNPGVLSTHIAIKYPDGTIAVWNSDLVGANNYNYNSISENYLAQTSLSVKGLVGVSTSFKDKIHTILSGSIRMIAGVINKSELRSLVYKIITRKFRGYDINDLDTNGVLNIWDSPGNFKIGDVKVFYYKFNGGDRLVIPGKIGSHDKILLITQGINIFITGDIQMANDGILGIISLEDKNNINGGNIYINTNVTNLEAYIYTDRALISYKGNPLGTFNTQDVLSQDDLSNQLLIDGVLWSFNTLGGSVNGKCPYFDMSCTNPKKYDLEYLRRFYLVKNSVLDLSGDSNSYIPYGSPNTKLIGGIKCELKLIGSKKYTYCKDFNTNLRNILDVNSSRTGPLFKEPLSKQDLENLAPVIVEYNNKFKSIYLPVFSDVVNGNW